MAMKSDCAIAELEIVLERAGDDLFGNVCDAVRDAVWDAASKAQRAILKAIAEAKEGDDVRDDVEEAVDSAAEDAAWDAEAAIERIFGDYDWTVEFERRRAGDARV
jgi:hypothetical protein